MSNPQGGVFVQFYTEAVEIKFESERQGRPIFKDMPHIRKVVPGDSTNIIEKVAKEFDQLQYPQQWAAYKRSESEQLTGTPLSQWQSITRSQAKEANYFEIRTVEQLADLSDISCQKLGMGFSDLRAKAQKFLGLAGEDARDAETAELRKEIEQMKMALQSIESPKKGRPRKTIGEDLSEEDIEATVET